MTPNLTRRPNPFSDRPKGHAGEVVPGWLDEIEQGQVAFWSEFLEPPVHAGQLRRAHNRLTTGVPSL